MNTAKFFSSSQTSSGTLSSVSHLKVLTQINKKVIKVDALLKNSLSLRKKLQEKTVIKKSQLNFEQKEKNLEKTKPPAPEKGVKSIPTPSGGGLFGWLGNFINNVIFGFIAIRLLDHLPTLLKLVPIINNVMDGIIDWGGKLLEGLVTFIDWGYSAYDNTVKIFAKFGGEGAAKKFEGFMGKFKDVLNYSIIAGMLFSDLAMMGGGEDEGYDDFIDEKRNRPRPERPSRPVKPSPPKPGRPSLPRGGAPIGTLGKGGAKTVLKFIKPFTNKLPIIGGLLDFGLSVALGEDPGRAAFKAIGATLLGAVGAALGGPFALLTGLAGGMLGDKAGGALYDAFFKGDKKKKASSKKGWFGMRNGGVIRRYASGGSTRGGQYQSSSARREVGPQKKLRRVVTKPAKLYQGRTAGGVDNIQKIFPEPQDIKSPQGTKSQRKDETMNPYGFVSHSYYRMASVPFVGPILAMPLKLMMGDTIDSSYYTSVGQGFNGMMAKAYDEGAFSDDFPIQEFDFEKIVSKSVQQLATREMTAIRSDLMQQLMLKGIEIKSGQKPSDCPCPEPGGGGGGGGSSAYYGTPEQKALLDAIAFAEGTRDAPHGGYRTMYGHDIFNAPPWKHPDTVVTKGYSSTAAGRYQFLSTTWNGLGLSDFSPINQDKGAWKLVEGRGVTLAMLQREGPSANVIAKLAPEWASLPTLSGRSYYGQPVKSLSNIQSAYRSSLSKGGGTSPPTQIASSSPAGSVPDCSCDGDGVPDSNGIDSPTNPEALGPVGNNGKIYLHWTAGDYTTPYPAKYHSTFLGDGRKVQQVPYTQFRTPEGHTKYRNSKGVGLSVAAMKDYNWGSFSPKPKQLEAMAQEAANLAKAWGWTSSMVNVRNVATHAEVGSMKDGERNPPSSENKKTPPPAPDNYGPVAWGGDGARTDMYQISASDSPGSGGDKMRNMIKAKMGSAGKFGGGPVDAGITKVHPGEFIIDKDSVDVFGMEFMNTINQVENKTQLSRAKQSLIQILQEKVPYYSDMAADEYITVPSSGGGYSQNVVVMSGGMSGGGSYDNCPWKDVAEFGN